jgi:uncharacterized protein
MYKISKYIVISDIDNLNKIIYSTLSGKTIQIENSTFEKISNGRFELLTLNEKETLIDSKIILNENINETSNFIEYIKSKSKESSVLGFTITPSASCQMGCDYCGQEHSNIKITPILEDKIYNYIINRLKETKKLELHITWFGAEPLTGLIQLKNLSNRLIEYCTENGVNYNANIITNGVKLKKELFYDLYFIHKINDFQITIDGFGDTHDMRRPLKNGQKSFNNIYSQIIDICNDDKFDSENMQVYLRSNIDSRNFDDIWKLMDLLEKDNIQNKVRFYVTGVHPWENDAHTLSLAKQEFADFELDVLGRMYLNNYLMSSELIPMPITNTCMATSNRNHELIDPSGNIFNCTEMPFSEKLLKYKTGNILNDTKFEDTYAIDQWYDKINNFQCSNCNLLPICGGHCPKHWIDAKYIPCPSFKHNITERLKLNYYYKLVNEEN